MTAPASSPVERLRLPAQAESVGRARRFVATTTASSGLDEDLVDTAVLLVSEVVTNVVVHVGADLEVTLTCCGDRAVVVEVLDPSPQHPVARAEDVESMSGRGLAMVELLASHFGSVPRGQGKVVWFSVGDPGGHPLPGTPGWTRSAQASPRVRLLGVPAGLSEVMRQHNDALVREYQLLAVPDGDGPGRTPDAERARLAAVARARASVAGQIRQAVLGAGTDDPAARVDVELHVSPDDASACADLPRVLDAAEALAADGVFLVRPALPELLALRDWVYGEVVGQLRGDAPTAWVVGRALEQPTAGRRPDVDLRWVASVPQALVVADDANRVLAVSPALADLLGWGPGELDGQRVTVIVPDRLREAHVTAFARHVQTGVAHVLGTELAVTARHRLGHEVPVRLRLELSSEREETVYLGWLSRR